jgi:hypothetical protein
MVAITARHDKILKRLVDTIQFGDITVDKIVPGAPGSNRPDIVIREGNKAVIIDVSCPFENDSESMDISVRRKVEKYNYLVDFFALQNVQAKVFGFIVGSLGGWYKANELVLNELEMSMRYRTLFRKLCCADAIQGSRNIYVEHVSGVPQ